VFYTEPDKIQFFAQQIEDFVTRSIGAGSRAVCLTARSPASFRAYPLHQQTTESTINEYCGEAFGISGDFSYGPFLIPTDVAAHVGCVPHHVGWAWRHFTFAVAHRLRYSLRMIEGNYECPSDQTGEGCAERAYRDRQLCENVAGLSLGIGGH
jgi:hypothetical protein